MALITKKGYLLLCDRLKLEIELEKKALEDKKKALGHGDLSENAEWESANLDLSRAQLNISILKKYMNEAEVFTKIHVTEGIVGFGATVVLEDEKGKEIKYTILSKFEADASKGSISIGAPLAKKMLGKTVDESFEFSTPGGDEKVYYILSITYDNKLFEVDNKL